MSRVTLSSCYDSLGQRVLGHELHLGDAVLLLDAGWTAECRREDLAELEQATSRADAGASCFFSRAWPCPAIIGRFFNTINCLHYM